MKRLLATVAVLLLLGFSAGCGPKITPHQRKEAASLVSEAQFASTLRDWARAEELMAKATKLCPDNGEYWLNLGSVRRRLDNLNGARSAYESAAKAFGATYKLDPRNPQPLMQQIYIYSLLGKPKEALKILKIAHEDHPDNPGVTGFTEETIERLRQEQSFKELAL
jgi:tetratricopeptide (TPR) repeat protein